MNYEKESLNRDNRRYFAIKTMLNGFRNIFSGKKLPVFLALEALLIGLLYLWDLKSPDYMRSFASTMQTITWALLQPFVLYICGYIPGSNRLYRDLVRIGLVNFANEGPIAIYRKISGDGITEFRFYSKGVTLSVWQDNIEAVQSALDMTVVSIEQGADHRTIIVKAVPTSDILNQTIYFDERYVDYQHPTRFCIGLDAAGQRVTYDLTSLPMGLISGSTGSGKTSLSKIIIIEAALRDYIVYILDFKGLDFNYLHERYGVSIQTDLGEIINSLHHIEIGISERREKFLEVGAKDLQDYISKTGDTSMKRVLIYVDECAMLVDYGTDKESKKVSSDVVDKLSAIARVGRAFGFHLLISTQRPDANAVPGSIKSNLDLRICGKADATLSTIVLGDGRANEMIPKNSVGLFLMSDGVQDRLFKAFYLNDGN